MLNEVRVQEFDAVYAILADSFPKDEIRPYQPQKDLFAREDYRVLGLYSEENREIKAIMAVYDLGDVLFLEHFAVHSRYRNQGLGALVLRELVTGCGKSVCLEAEPPETKLAKRRIGFYERNGFFLSDYPYIQPPLAENQEPVELKIMCTGKPLSEPEFQKIRNLLYSRVYGR